MSRLRVWLGPFFLGGLGTVFLISLYFLIMILATRSWTATWTQFQSLKFWIILLSLGFGFQLSLYLRLRQLLHFGRSANQVLITSGSTSTLGMLACCVHHLADVLPIVGLTGLSFLLISYQKPILFVSLLINLVGSVFLMWQLRRVSAMIYLEKGGDLN